MIRSPQCVGTFSEVVIILSFQIPFINIIDAHRIGVYICLYIKLHCRQICACTEPIARACTASSNLSNALSIGVRISMQYVCITVFICYFIIIFQVRIQLIGSSIKKARVSHALQHVKLNL